MYCQWMYMGKYFPRRRLFRFHVILSHLLFLLFECGSQTLPKRVTHHWHLLVWKKRKLRQRSSDSGCRQQPLHLCLSAAALFRCSSNTVSGEQPLRLTHTDGWPTFPPPSLQCQPTSLPPAQGWATERTSWLCFALAWDTRTHSPTRFFEESVFLMCTNAKCFVIHISERQLN